MTKSQEPLHTKHIKLSELPRGNKSPVPLKRELVKAFNNARRHPQHMESFKSILEAMHLKVQEWERERALYQHNQQMASAMQASETPNTVAQVMGVPATPQLDVSNSENPQSLVPPPIQL